jgi:hypothetical protein
MFNFNAIVDTIILEAQANTKLGQVISNPPFLGLFDVYKATFGIDLANDPNLETALNLVLTSGQRIASRDVLAPAIPIMDAFEGVHTYLVGQNSYNLKTKTDLDSFLEEIQTAKNNSTDWSKIESIVNTAITNIKNVQTSDPLDYRPSSPKTAAAHRTLTSEFDKLSQTAVEQLGRDTIQNAIQKIITKRVSVSNRILAGKGIRKPFQSTLLIPLFDYYKNYTTGGGIIYDKIPGDFKDAVDQLSIDKIINVAILSGEYYLSLLRKQMAAAGQQQQVQQNKQQQNKNIRANVGRSQAGNQSSGFKAWAQSPQGQGPTVAAAPAGAPPSPVNASLLTFDDYARELLGEANPQRGLTKDVYDGTARAIGTARLSDFVLFIKEGKSLWLPETQQQQGQQQTQQQQGQQQTQQRQSGPVIYNLETISKDTSKEAQALYTALRSMAYYTRETSGFGYRSQQLGKAMGSLAQVGGAKLYGGPGT